VLECVVNVAEGRRLEVLDSLSAAAGPSLRDRHHDVVHNRGVFTLIDEVDRLRHSVRALSEVSLETLDLRAHEGVHPRLGVLDVVPFVALDPNRADEAIALRDETANWLATTFDVPVFLYGELDDGTTRTLPEVRRGAFISLAPDRGPATPDPKWGATTVGARGVLVAWNLWLRGVSLEEATLVAAAIRGPAVRALAFSMGEFVQVSCNLIDPLSVGPSQVYDQVTGLLGRGAIDHAELVGLAPGALLQRENPTRWPQLGLSEATTIEARLG
jgi:glutamate formiminotransferase